MLPLLALCGTLLLAGIRGAAKPPGLSPTADRPLGLLGQPGWVAVSLTSAFVAHLVTQQFGILEVGAATLSTLIAGAIVAQLSQPGHAASAESGAHARDASHPAPAHLTRAPVPLGVKALTAALVPALLAVLWWESRPFRANLAYSSALAASRAGHTDLEQSLLEDATRVWPHNYRYWVSLSEARREAARALPDSPATVQARSRLFTGALAAADRARAISPPDPVLLGIWADAASEASLALGDASLATRAEQAHTQATELAPNAWELWQSAGLHEYRQTRYAQARAAFERAVRIFDRNPITWALLGDTAGLVGDRAAARTAYRRSLDLDPSNQAVQRALTSLGPG